MNVEQVKCAVCKQYIDKAEAVEVEDNVYCCKLHKKAWDVHVREEHKLAKKREKDLLRQQLHQYIKKMYQIPELTPLMKKQIKQYTQEYKYTFRGIAKTLEYCFTWAEPPMLPQLDKGIGLVPYFYREAASFYRDKRDIVEQMKTLDPASIGRSQTIVIQAADRERTKRKPNLIDMENLGGYDDGEE